MVYFLHRQNQWDGLTNSCTTFDLLIFFDEIWQLYVEMNCFYGSVKFYFEILIVGRNIILKNVGGHLFTHPVHITSYKVWHITS